MRCSAKQYDNLCIHNFVENNRQHDTMELSGKYKALTQLSEINEYEHNYYGYYCVACTCTAIAFLHRWVSQFPILSTVQVRIRGEGMIISMLYTNR